MVFGQTALTGLVPIITGGIIHLVVATALGVLFAWLVGLRQANLVLWGMAYGAIIWLVVQFVALPLLNPLMAEEISPLLFLIDHLVYGAFLGGYLTEGQRV